LVVLILFGLKWFGSSSPVNYPPQINTCPDFLTYYERTDSQTGIKLKTCIDLVGVSKNGQLKRFVKDIETQQEPSGDDSYFSLDTVSSNAIPKRNELCNRAMMAGLTWEGITNGDSCIQPSSNSSKSDETSNNCPTIPACGN
jgi:hypothetical protein